MANFVDKLSKTIGISGRTTSLRIKTINGGISGLMAVEDIQVVNINKATNGWINLPATFTRPKLTINNKDVAQPSQLKQWKDLGHIKNQLNWYNHIPVDLLIREICAKALEPLEIFQSSNNGSCWLKTRLTGVHLVQWTRTTRTHYHVIESLLDKQLFLFKWKTRCIMTRYQVCSRNI